MNIVITGYYKKDNFGDDLFELIADKLFQSDKLKKQICNYEIIPINNLLKKCKENNKNDNIIPDCIILFGGETLNDYFLDNLIRVYEYYKNIYEFISNNDTNILLYGIYGFPTDLFIEEIIKFKFRHMIQ